VGVFDIAFSGSVSLPYTANISVIRHALYCLRSTKWLTSDISVTVRIQYRVTFHCPQMILSVASIFSFISLCCDPNVTFILEYGCNHNFITLTSYPFSFYSHVAYQLYHKLPGTCLVFTPYRHRICRLHRTTRFREVDLNSSLNREWKKHEHGVCGLVSITHYTWTSDGPSAC